MSLGLRWTGHALIDMGVAAVVLATGNKDPKEVTQAQWAQWMDELEQDYKNEHLKKPCSILFTLNAFDNPSWQKNPAERTRKIEETFAYARGKKSSLAFGEPCTFFPERLAVVRAARDLFPLLQGQRQLNFYPTGRPELPLSDLALGCVLSLPRVAPVVSGRLMIVGSERLELVLDLCDIWKDELDRELALLRAGKDWRDRKAPRTRLLEALVEVFRMPKRYHFSLGGQEASLTLYHLSNSGNAPGIDLYTVPPVVHRFLARAGSAAYQAHWKALVQAFWFRKDKKDKQEQPFEEADRLQAFNEVYERLSELPLEVDGFIRRIFLRYVLSRVGVRRKLHTTDIDQWPLVELFLKEIIGDVMHTDRIQMIRRLADELAREIHEQNDRRLYRQLMGLASGTDAYRAFRALLLRALRERLRRENQLLFTLEDYLLLFEEAEGFPSSDWRLVRDLIRIRVLEELYHRGFFQQAPELLEEEINIEE
ncbi:hypothetical protein [Rhodothermus bifroesti]|jgi:CRISPR-associated protein Cst1|uniref:Type I-B CRISPR-associated protein Cas8b1/Cst1 n=1 Tax=Rhodothermus marinus TaxID=29549 RepID=A0A7V2F5Z8_RHOMR|nr:hypothetical protein [Rhodothermus bifroesti]GBD01747.1 hypothetical protein HRbin18_01474 [bacterium HR18]